MTEAVPLFTRRDGGKTLDGVSGDVKERFEVRYEYDRNIIDTTPVIRRDSLRRGFGCNGRRPCGWLIQSASKR